jgi:hypothetical protein
MDWIRNRTYITYDTFDYPPPSKLSLLNCRINQASRSLFTMSATSSSSASYSVDIEAQNTLSGTTTSPSVPMPVLTHEVRTPAQVALPIDPMDDFFGYTLSSTRTHDSRHDGNNAEVPPPYVEDSNPPEYTPYAEPVTLAMYLFKFGFCKFYSIFLL